MKTEKQSKADALLDKLRGYLAIDKHSLDDEIVQQPQLFFEISEASVNATARRDFLKEEIARVDAALHAKHRRQIEKSGARATDAGVSAAIAADPKHHAAVDAHISARQQADLLLALKDSFHQRSYMLRDLASLSVANYFERNAVTDNNVTRDFKAQKVMDKLGDARAAKGSLANKRKRNREG